MTRFPSQLQACAHIEVLFSCKDVLAVRHATVTIGNIAMDPLGRKELLKIFTIIQVKSQAKARS